ncbi:MAG: hypothetical protein C5B50_05260 [Verrucomicrobia bacterium]|nr:MAG: hypothetical protein C5B50_05260 [Verrucomicrobiota bacterium]
MISCDRRNGSETGKDAVPQTRATTAPTPQAMSELDAGLIEAAIKGDVKTVGEFLKRGANLKSCREDGCTALHGASWDESSFPVLKLLVLSGAPLDVKERLNGYTAMHWATFKGSVAMVQYLVEAGATVNVGDKNGLTAFGLARTMQQSTHVENYGMIAAILRDHGGRVSIRPGTPVDISAEVVGSLIRALDIDASPESGSLARQIANEGTNAVPPLAEVIANDQEPKRKRDHAIFILSKIRPLNPEAVAAFEKALSDKSLDDGLGDVLGLIAQCEFCSQTMVPKLITMLEDPREQVRTGAAAVLGHRQCSGSVPIEKWLEMVGDKSQFVRFNALLALGNMPTATPEVLEAFRRIADTNGEEERVRELARIALKKFQPAAR